MGDFLESIISSSLDNLRDICYGMVIPEHLQKTPCEKQRAVVSSSVLPYRKAESAIATYLSFLLRLTYF
jgi:hypothetical protein